MKRAAHFFQIFQQVFQQTATPLLKLFAELLAPRHCLLCDVSLTFEKPATLAYSNVQSSVVCQRCHDALQPAQPPDTLFNRLLDWFPPDNIALSSISALYSLQAAPMPSAQEQTFFESVPQTISPINIIYALKYKGCATCGEELGKELGVWMKTKDHKDYKDNAPYQYDAIVPVPLHSARERERGYNQAYHIARGMASVLAAPVRTTWLRRTRYTETQTQLAGAARVHNVADVFAGGTEARAIRGATVLLVDDVLTTGSTLNACAQSLLQLGARRVDAATLVTA